MRADLLHEATRADEVQQVQMLTALRQDWLQLTSLVMFMEMDNGLPCRNKAAKYTACIKT